LIISENKIKIVSNINRVIVMNRLVKIRNKNHLL